jgi:hypothetical protein
MRIHAFAVSATCAFTVVGTAVAEEPAQPASSDLAEIEAALGRDAKPSTAPATEAPAKASGGVQSLNPDISVIADFALAAFSDDHNYQTGGHDPTETGFNLQQLELSFAGAVDPYFRFDSHLVFGPEGFELEEAYGTTLDLPAHLQVRAGQFLTRFGRLNATHPHAWDFVDQPFALGRVFGGDANRGLGAELSFLTPLPWYVELVGSATRADGEGTNRSFFGANNPGVNGVRDLLYVAAIKQFFPLSADWSLAWGVSVARGPNGTGPRHGTYVYGSDVYLKYRPIRRESQTQVTLQLEWLLRQRELGDATLHDFGSYAQLVYRFARRYSIGARYEYGTPSRDGHGTVHADDLDPTWISMRTRETFAATFYPTEFSRLRLQGSRDSGLGQRDPIWTAFLAVEFLIGAHGAHAF